MEKTTKIENANGESILSGYNSKSDESGQKLSVESNANSVIPPYLLDALVKGHTAKQDVAETLRLTKEMKDHLLNGQPHLAQDFHGAREVYDAKGSRSQPGDKARFEGEAATGNDDTDKAYDYTGIVRDFYEKEFGRNSIDGEGMKFISTVNYGLNFMNAVWDGSEMVYGHQGPDSPFKSFVILDICGHEITHGVTQNESNLKYEGQSGALNESLSDVFGELIKQYSLDQTADQADWLVGAGIWKDGINSKHRALRDMLNPGTAYDDPVLGKDPQPAHMKDYVKKWGDDDNGGVHYNSGIPNRAFALFARAVGGYAFDAPGHIWFAARKAAGSNPSFAQFANQTIDQAFKLGHADEVEKLNHAWQEVGVTPSLTAKDTETPHR